MLFTFGTTVAVTFLLTAAQTWTNQRSLHGGGLIFFCILWLTVRVLLLLDGSTAIDTIVIIAQGFWWLIAITTLSKMVFKTRSRRNYQFVVILSIMMSLNIGFLIAEMKHNYALTIHLATSTILVFALLAGIMGGRVIPFFTRRGAEKAVVKETPRLNKLALPISVAAIVVYFVSYFTTLIIGPGSLLIIAGSLHLLQLCHWNSLATIKVPLLWSLHASYLALGLGLILVGSSYFSDAFHFSDAIHIITIGSIGGMILAMIARVSLGHTGRPLTAHPMMSIAFTLLFIAAALRFLLPQFGQPVLAWDISASLWIIAFGTFLFHYTSVLIKPRQPSQ